MNTEIETKKDQQSESDLKLLLATAKRDIKFLHKHLDAYKRSISNQGMIFYSEKEDAKLTKRINEIKNRYGC